MAPGIAVLADGTEYIGRVQREAGRAGAADKHLEYSCGYTAVQGCDHKYRFNPFLPDGTDSTAEKTSITGTHLFPRKLTAPTTAANPGLLSPCTKRATFHIELKNAYDIGGKGTCDADDKQQDENTNQPSIHDWTLYYIPALR